MKTRGKQQLGTRVLQDELDSLRGITWVQRDICGPSFPDSNDTDNHVDALVKNQCDAIFHFDVLAGDHPPRQLVGPGIEIGEGDACVTICDGNPIGLERCFLLEKLT
jgi:hypothetical protein